MNRFNAAEGRRLGTFLVLIFLATGASSLCLAHAQQRDSRIAAIQLLESQINSQIAANEKEELAAPVFRNELILNSKEHPWPAVGIYKSVIRFYYTFSHKEGEPYPNQLLKITVETKRSDRSEAVAYFFNPAGQLVFCLRKSEAESPASLGYYFAGGALIGLTRDKQMVERFTAAQVRAARDSQKEALQLKGIFSVTN